MKRLFVLLATAIVLVAGAALLAISLAKVEMTESGVHTRLLVPVGPAAIGLQAYGGTGEDVVLDGHLDGPVVRRETGGGWAATWFCENRPHSARGRSGVLRIVCAGRQHVYPLDSAPVPPAVAPMPEKLVVLSDLEGNIRFLDAALEKLGVTGPDGRWHFGAGQLVVLGDSVDRGRDVFAVLWRLHALAREAHARGGAVRMVLGNHDQYILRGNTSRAHPEHRYAMRQMGGVSRAFAADTVIGAWLRAQPVALKLGDVLFVHGGVSPDIVATGLSIDDLNAAMRSYWQDPPMGGAKPSDALGAVLGNAGVTQYRGYFRALEDVYQRTDTAGVDRVLDHFSARQVVVAHTVVERVTPMYGGRVYAVDVNNAEARREVLVYESGVPAIVDIGVPRSLDRQPRTRTREFSLLQGKDRQLVRAMLRAYRDLSGIPQPY